MIIQFVKLERSFFDHPKINLLVERHGLAGAYCILFIWSEMMHRDGVFDSSNEYDIMACALKCKIPIEQIKIIIEACVKLKLLTPIPKNRHLFNKDRIDDTLVELKAASDRGRKAGLISAQIRKEQREKALLNDEQILNTRSTPVQHPFNTGQQLKEVKTMKRSNTTEGSSVTSRETGNGTPLPLRGQGSSKQLQTGEEYWMYLQDIAEFKSPIEIRTEGAAIFDKILTHPQKAEIFEELKNRRERPDVFWNEYSAVHNVKVAAWTIDKEIFPELTNPENPEKPYSINQLKKMKQP